MNPTSAQIVLRGDVFRHLRGLLHVHWRRHRKRLKHCRKQLSARTVHDSRVATRRLISILDLLEGLVASRERERAQKALKSGLDTFGRLRDTHVQLALVRPMERRFPAARKFSQWLGKREASLARRTQKAAKQIKTSDLRRSLAAFEKEVGALGEQISEARARTVVWRTLTRAFRRVVQLRGRIRPDNTATVHRMRIAFKHFRYLLEALAPLLPAVTAARRRALRNYQTTLGAIQDHEVLLARLDRFRRKKTKAGPAARRFRDELLQRRQRLLRTGLQSADKLDSFWPLPDRSAPARARGRQPGAP